MNYYLKMNNLDYNKKPLFDLCLQKFKDNKGKGIVVLPTGVGKTVLGVYLISKFIEEQKQSKRKRTVVLVNNQLLIKQWQNSISTFLEDYNTISRYIKIATPDTYESDEDCELLIVDEVHNYTTQRKVEFINKTKINYKFCLGLTGSMNENNIKILTQYLPIIYNLSLQEAIDKKYIPNLIEYNFGIEFSEPMLKKYNQYCDFLQKGIEKYGSYNTIMECVIGRKDYFNTIPAEIVRDELASSKMFDRDMICDNQIKKDIYAEWHPDTIKAETSKYMFMYRERTKFVDDYIDKSNFALDLYNKLKLPTIFFCKSTFVADYIKQSLGDECALYHSNLKGVELQDENGNIIMQKNGAKPKTFGATYFKKDAIDGMKSGKYKCLSTVMALNEGLDISNLKLAIITAGTYNSNQQIQRKGRVLRFEDYLTKNEKSFVVNIFVKDSRDEDKLFERQKFSTNYVKIVENFEDLLLDIKNNI